MDNAVACPSCGQPNPPNMRFCGYCGGRLGETTVDAPRPSILASTGATDEDRRLVTVLFCDLVGFTPLSEQLDPEEVREIQDTYFASMSAEIHRYGGTVEKYAGDAVLAIFGAPTAHEDDPERAVRCALAMQRALAPLETEARRRWSVELALRIGINTGEVVRGMRQIDGRSEQSVTGDAVNTAARLQSVAEPGAVMVGAETMRLSHRSVLFGERQAVTLKGKSGAVSAYRVRGLRDRVMERWQAGADRTPLVGRERELDILLQAWTRSVEGSGQYLALIAEPGMGKSRLVAEAIERIDRSHRVSVLRGRCLSHTQSVSFSLLADLLRSVLGAEERRPPEKAEAMIRGLLQNEDDHTIAMAVDIVSDILGLPTRDSTIAHLDARIRRHVLVRSLRLLLSALSQRDPTVVVLEDLHWLDAASGAVLAEVIPQVHALQVFVVVTYRPESPPPFPAWPWTQAVQIPPLSEDEIPRLARAVLKGKALSTELEHRITERADGNPFFVEELLRSLQDSGSLAERAGKVHLAGITKERLPSTLLEVLLDRLDRLPPPARSVAQVASVIGRNFSVEVLAHAAQCDERQLQPALGELERAALILPRWSAELEYVFRHATIREAAYNTLLLRRRQELHAAVARALVARHPADESAEVIAYHYARSQEWNEATFWLERAGDRAAQVYANDTALTHYGEARKRLERIGADETTLARLDRKLATVLGRIGLYGQALETGERAARVFRQVDDLEALGSMVALLGHWHLSAGALDEGRRLVRTTIKQLEGSDATWALALLSSALAQINLVRSDNEEGMQAAERAAAYARVNQTDHSESLQMLAEAEMLRGMFAHALGRIEECRQTLEAAKRLAESSGALAILGRVLTHLGDVSRPLGELDQSRAYLRQAIDVLERVGDPGAAASLSLAMTLTFMGAWEDARREMERGDTIVRALHITQSASRARLLRGWLALLQGRREEAVRELEACRTLAQSTGNLEVLEQAESLLAELDLRRGRRIAAQARLEPLVTQGAEHHVGVLVTLASVYLELGRLEQAEDTVMRGLVVATSRHQKLLLVEALRVHGTVLARLRRWEEARSVFEASVSAAREISYPYGEGRTLYEYGMALMQRGMEHEAGLHLVSALTIFRQLGAALDAERTQQALAG